MEKTNYERRFGTKRKTGKKGIPTRYYKSRLRLRLKKDLDNTNDLIKGAKKAIKKLKFNSSEYKILKNRILLLEGMRKSLSQTLNKLK